MDNTPLYTALKRLRDASSSSTLKILDEMGIMSSDGTQECIMERKIEKVKELHKYAIIPPPKDGDRWQTTVKLDEGKRKSIRARTEKELYQKLLQHYETTFFNSKTFKHLYDEWIEYKATITESNNTIIRHKQHYKRYFAGGALENVELKHFSKMLLNQECNRIVKDFQMSRKEWVNVKTILRGMFAFAEDKGYLKENLSDKIKITVKYRQINKQPSSTQTFNSEERAKLFDYLKKRYDETGDVAFMAVLINFYLGLRVAELTALKWEDVLEDAIHVVREEVRDQTTNITSIVNHTKTSRDRFVSLIPVAKGLLEKLPHNDDEYIFVRSNGKRLISKDVATVLEKYAKINGLDVKSTHKIRKTYASMLNAGGVPLDAIREELGHTSLNTTLSYIFNPLTDKETKRLIENAL